MKYFKWRDPQDMNKMAAEIGLYWVVKTGPISDQVGGNFGPEVIF